MTWHPEQEAKLKKLWAEGVSASKIAEALGGILSRNAVLGKVSRLNLPKRRNIWTDAHLRPKKVTPQKAPRPRVEKPKPNPKPKFNFGSVWGNYPKVKPEPFVPRAADIVSRKIGLLDLTSTTCRWPDDERNDQSEITFCGHPAKEGLPYCPSHCALAYQPPKKERTEKQKEADQRLAQRHRSARSLPAKKWLAEEAA